MNRKAGTT